MNMDRHGSRYKTSQFRVYFLVYLLVPLHNNIGNCCVLGVCADVFVLLTFFIA